MVHLKRRDTGNTTLHNHSLNVETILAKPDTPNRRNTKRALDHTPHETENQPPSRKCNRLEENHHPEPLDIVDFIRGVTVGTLQGNTHPRKPIEEGWKYQKVPNKRPKKVYNHQNHSHLQDDETQDKSHFFLKDKTDQDRNDWYIGRRQLGCATKHASRRSFLRQAFNHNLMTEWSTSHEAMPPWLRNEDLDTKVFKIKARASREIMRESINYLDGIVSGLEKQSAESLIKVEPKFTPEELLASRAALTEHGRIVSNPLKQVLSEKREYLRRNQPSLEDLITMRNRERDFPKKNNAPPAQKKRAPSAAAGRAPDKWTKKGGAKKPLNPSWADLDNDGGSDRGTTNRNRRRESPQPDRKRPRWDPSRGGGHYHYDSDSDGKENPRRKQGSRRSRSRDSTPRRRRSPSPDNSKSHKREDFQKSGRGRGAPRQTGGNQRRAPSKDTEKPRGQRPSRRHRKP